MTQQTANPQLDAFFSKAKKWQEELRQLRSIALDCGLTEERKWGKPCYTHQGGNVVIIIGFKEYCALMLFKGALLKDPKGILIQPTENSQAGRQIRFTGVQEIIKAKAAVKACLREAMAVEKAGLKVAFKKAAEFAVPEELQHQLDRLPALKKAFAALTPGRQRAYFLHIAGAKQAKTRVSRVEKCMPRILDGKGLDDQ